MADSNQFIEIKKVVSDKASGVNTDVNEQTINVSDIKSFRAWHKGKNDVNIKGDVTILLLQSESKMVENNGDGNFSDKSSSKFRTILIAENYKEFQYRLSLKCTVKDLDRKLYEPS